MTLARLPITNCTVGWMFESNPELQEIILPIWCEHEQPSATYLYLSGILTALIGFVGVATNCYVLYVLATRKSIERPFNWFMINLAISDLGLALTTCFPLKVIPSFTKIWIWGKPGCMFYGFCGGLFGFTSLCTLAVIAYRRYYAVVKAHTDPKQVSARTALLTILFVWHWSFIWPLLPFFGVGRYVLEGFLTTSTFDYVSTDSSNLFFCISLYLGGFLCPFSVIVYSYVGIICFVRKSEREISSYSRGGRLGNRRLQISAAKWSALFVLMYIVAWGPYALVCATALLGYKKHLTPYITEFPGLFAKTASIYNPIIYVLRNPSLRKREIRRFRLCQLNKIKISLSERFETLGRST
uniref:Opsin 2 n=1 Tax=Cryptocotyle lingua TaxID=66766 RepID=A0A7U0TIE5_9TREM|nr:opsin 2 [Cryptocotyle lingua]